MAAREHIDQALRKLHAERERLEAELSRTAELIALLEAAARELVEETSTPATQPESEPEPEPEPPIALPEPPRPYTEMNVIQAACSALRAYGDQHNTDLAKILLAGGFRTRSAAAGFPDTLRVMLKRPKAVRAGIRRTDDWNWTIVESSE